VLKGRDVADAVARDRERFLEMRYCLPVETTLPLAAELLATILPQAGYAQRFAEALGAVARATTR